MRLIPIALFVLASATAAAQTGESSKTPFASADAAQSLRHKLDASGLTAIAASDPAAPGHFVAALYIPGSQLLVVSAHHPSSDGVAYRIVNKQFQEVYLDLQGTPTQDGKFFIHDAGADGILSASPNSGAVDVLYEDGVRQTLFNGDVKGQKLTREEYAAKLAEADRRYADLLQLLAGAV